MNVSKVLVDIARSNTKAEQYLLAIAIEKWCRIETTYAGVYVTIFYY